MSQFSQKFIWLMLFVLHCKTVGFHFRMGSNQNCLSFTRVNKFPWVNTIYCCTATDCAKCFCAEVISHLHIFSSHLLMFTSSLLLISSSHLHIFTSSLFFSSHLLIFTSCHLHMFACSHLHILHLHIFLLPHQPCSWQIPQWICIASFHCL